MKSVNTGLQTLDILDSLPRQVHICQFYQEEMEYIDAAVFLIQRKKNGPCRFLWVLPPELSADSASDLLIRKGIFSDKEELLSFLRFDSSAEWHSIHSPLSENTLREKRNAELAEFFNTHGTDLCVIVHIPCDENGVHPSAPLWENVFRSVVPHAPIVLLCQYDARYLSPYDFVDLSALHEYILTKRENAWKLTTNLAHEEVTQELARSRDYYLTLFEEFPALIWRSGLDGLCNYFNKNWLAFTGRTMEQEYGNGWAEGVHPDDYDRCVEHYMTNFEKRAPFYMEYRIKRHDGVYRWISDMGMPFYDMNHNFAGYIGSCYDITEHLEMEEHLRIISKESQDANLSKSIFLSNMSHEIRTPMNGVLGMLELLSMTELTDTQRDYIDKAETSAKLLLRIINDILDLSKIEAGKLEFESHPFHVHQIAETILETLRPNAEKKSLILFDRLDEHLPTLLEGDSVRLCQILINLMGNAVKFTDIGRVTLSIDLVSESEKEATLLFAVKDTGIGIPASQMDELFQSFSQLSNAGERKYGGTGLGLVIAKQLVNKMGGELQVESIEGKGSTFYFALSFSKVATKSDSKESLPDTESSPLEKSDNRSKGPIKKSSPKRKPRLLVAEDDEINQQILSVFLSEHYDMDIAANGAEAVALFEKQPYDIILMDVLMPVLDGFDATGKIREKELHTGQHIPIIGFTAYAMINDGVRCMESGMDSYLSKPIDKKTLLDKLFEFTCL